MASLKSQPVFEAQRLLVQNAWTPSLYRKHGFYSRPGFYFRICGNWDQQGVIWYVAPTWFVTKLQILWHTMQQISKTSKNRAVQITRENRWGFRAPSSRRRSRTAPCRRRQPTKAVSPQTVTADLSSSGSATETDCSLSRRHRSYCAARQSRGRLSHAWCAEDRQPTAHVAAPTWTPAWCDCMILEPLGNTAAPAPASRHQSGHTDDVSQRQASCKHACTVHVTTFCHSSPQSVSCNSKQENNLQNITWI